MVKTIYKNIEDKQLIGHSQHRFTVRKPHMTNLIAFYSVVASLVGKMSSGCLSLLQ